MQRPRIAKAHSKKNNVIGFTLPGRYPNITETGWDLGPFAAVLAPGQTSPQAAEYKETTRD